MLKPNKQIIKLLTNILNRAQCSIKIFSCPQEKRLLFGISTSPFLHSLRYHRRIHAMKTTSWIRTYKIEKIRTYLKGAHPLTCLRSCLQSILRFFTDICIHWNSFPAVRNMLWTKEMHHTLFMIVKNKQFERKARTRKECWPQHVMFVVNAPISAPRFQYNKKTYYSLIPRCYSCCLIPLCLVAKIKFQ